MSDRNALRSRILDLADDTPVEGVAEAAARICLELLARLERAERRIDELEARPNE